MYCRIIICLVLSSFSITTFSQPQTVSPLVSSYQDYVTMKDNTTYGFEWIPLGPVINSALVETFQVDPNRPGTIYLGFGSGNLWKTTNNGLTWNPIFENQPVYGIGDIKLAPSNTNIIYLGTGETLKKPRNFTMPGNGIYRSDDAGEHWNYLGLEDSWHIGKIEVHPTNPDIVYVAVLGHFWTTNSNRGIYRSMNGGKNWEHVLYVDEKTGANNIVISPSNPSVLYASMWENYPGVSGAKSGIYKSIDAGKTWTKSDNGLPTDEGKGRIGLAVSYQNSNKVYALIDHRNKPKLKSGILTQDSIPGAAEVYQSLDGGKTWSRSHKEELMIFSALGWYFSDINVDPNNDDEIYALGVRIAHSKDGGKTFNLIGGDVYHLYPSPAVPLHLDQSGIWIDPKNSDHLALSNDGGFYVSYDKGKTWLHYNNIPTGEFYDITLDNKDDYTIYGGTQDDATVYGKAKEWDSKFDNEWKYLWVDPWSGGDGCITVLDPKDSNTIYYSSQEGGIQRMNLNKHNSVSVRPSMNMVNDSIHYNFISPYFLSSHNHAALYLAGNYVFKSNNKGDSWEVISKNLSSGLDKNKKSLAAGAMAESDLEKGVIYVGTDKGLFWLTMNDGNTWIDRSLGLPNKYIRCITPSKYKKSRVYIAMSGMNYDDFGTYLFVSEDYGNTWNTLNHNLPNEVSYVIKEDPFNENVLYAGLYRGAYVSIDRGITWSLLGKNMPAAAVADIEINQKSKDIVVATHGRGIYKLNLAPFYSKLDIDAKDLLLFDLPKVNVTTPDTRDDSNSRMLTKMPISFWVNQPGVITLKVFNSNNVMIWQKTISVKKGHNQYRWDLTTKSVESPLPYFINYNELLKKGNYKLELEANGKTVSKTFEAVQ